MHYITLSFDEILLNQILGCESNTSNAFKYLELGIYPVRYEIMKRKILFLHYILQQEKTSMVYKVFKATCENPLKNDFVQTCESYLKQLDINMTFEELGKLSTWSCKKLVKVKTCEAGFRYLINLKNKQSKIMNIQYSDLNIQEYLLEGNKNNELAKVIFKARAKCLELKTHKKWKYSDDICIGCGNKSETEEELLSYRGFKDKNNDKEVKYGWVFTGSVNEMFELAKVVSRRLKLREKLLEGIT